MKELQFDCDVCKTDLYNRNFFICPTNAHKLV